MTLEVTDLIKDFIATSSLSKVELDFLEGELWDTFQNINEITSLTIAPADICKGLSLNIGSSWHMCCATVLDKTRPIKTPRAIVLNKLIREYSINKK
tara:strand:+ start:66 stop:356 length:291 start_codon:yes stop_codon:yes gene_type:complete